MTNKELQEKLKQYPDDLEIQIIDPEGQYNDISIEGFEVDSHWDYQNHKSIPRLTIDLSY